jgi:hypothetical protein
MQQLFCIVTNSFPAAVAPCFVAGSTLSGTACIDTEAIAHQSNI